MLFWKINDSVYLRYGRSNLSVHEMTCCSASQNEFFFNYKKLMFLLQAETRMTAAFVLALMVNNYRSGQVRVISGHNLMFMHFKYQNYILYNVNFDNILKNIDIIEVNSGFINSCL